MVFCLNLQLCVAFHLNSPVKLCSSSFYLFIEVFIYLLNCQSVQENIRRCVCIIYDPSRSNQGVLALKALKLSDSFMELYRANNFTGEKYGFSLLSKIMNMSFLLSLIDGLFR